MNVVVLVLQILGILILAVLLLLAIFLLLPAGIEAFWKEQKAEIWLSVGPLRRRFYPPRAKRETEKKQTGKTEKPKPESPEPEKRQTPVPEPEPSEPEKRRASVPEPPEPKKGRTPPSPELPEPENICLLCGLAVDKTIDFNPDGPVRLQVISEEGADFLLYSDMRVEPGKRCYSGFNGMAYFRNRHFNLLYEFRNRAGNRMETDRADRTLRCLRLEKPAAVSVSGEGYILKEKGILIMEER